MTLSLNIVGIAELQKRISAIPENMGKGAIDQLMEAAGKMVSEAQSAAPVRTGFLRDNIRITNSNSFAVQVSSLAYYSMFVEFGTSRMRPEPFFLVAVLNNMPTAAMLLASFVI